MKLRIFNIALFIIFVLCGTSYAGISVCHTGETVTKTTLRGNQIPGCEYITENDNYDAVRTLIKTVPRPYLKWTTTLEEMTQAEKDAVDFIKQQEAGAAEQSRIDKLDITIEDGFIALVKRINDRLPANKITKQEIVDQIKCDKGYANAMCP